MPRQTRTPSLYQLHRYLGAPSYREKLAISPYLKSGTAAGCPASTHSRLRRVTWPLLSLGAKTVLISLIATVSALPYTLLTLPAGAVADMVGWYEDSIGGLAVARGYRVRDRYSVDGTLA